MIKRSYIGPGCEISCSVGSSLTIVDSQIGPDCVVQADHGNAEEGAVVELRGVGLNRGSMIVGRRRIRIGEGTTVAAMTVIRDQDHLMPAAELRYAVDPIDIGEGVWIGTKATILRGSIVGDGATIAAHAVVKGEVEPGAVYGGIPASRIR